MKIRSIYKDGTKTVVIGGKPSESTNTQYLVRERLTSVHPYCFENRMKHASERILK